MHAQVGDCCLGSGAHTSAIRTEAPTLMMMMSCPAVLIDSRRRQMYDLGLVHLLDVEVRFPIHWLL